MKPIILWLLSELGCFHMGILFHMGSWNTPQYLRVPDNVTSNVDTMLSDSCVFPL